VPKHGHDSYLIALVEAGSGQHEDEAGRLPILAGDVCLVLPGQWHAYSQVHGTLSIFNLALTRSYLAVCAPLLGEVPRLGVMTSGEVVAPPAIHLPAHLRLSPFELSHFSALFRTLAAEFDEPGGSERSGVRAGLLLQILGLLYGGDHSATPRKMEHGSEEGGVLAAARYLEERYMGPVTVEELAYFSGYTPTYLTRKFHQQFGMSPSDYLRHLRIHHACTLLRDTNLSIAAVGRQVGFHDSHYFATRFHQAVGMTPSSFRARLKIDSQTSDGQKREHVD